MSANLPSGGPAYPLATPGMRLQVNPTDAFSLLAAVFSGDPAGKNCDSNPQSCNQYGTIFSFSGGAFWIGEAQYQVNQDKDARGLAAAYKFGAWYHTAISPISISESTQRVTSLRSQPRQRPDHFITRAIGASTA